MIMRQAVPYLRKHLVEDPEFMVCTKYLRLYPDLIKMGLDEA